MKKVLFIAVCLFCLQSHGNSQAFKAHYSISVGTFVDARREEFAGLASIGFLYSFKMENNLSEVFLGGYDSKEAAQTALGQVLAAGYSSARLQELPESEGAIVTVIQIASLDTRKPTDWKKYGSFTSLWGIVSGNSLKLLLGPYNSPEEARKALPNVQKEGYKDAFSRSINSTHLIKIGAFETGNVIKQPAIRFQWNPGKSDAPIATRQPVTYNTPPQDNLQPNAPLTVEKGIPATIRGNIKRRSALELQKILKAENYYTGSLDGYYGKGTAQGYQNALQYNRELNECQILAMNRPQLSAASGGDALQNTLNRLQEDSRAAIILESYNHPLANAYRAYQLFITLGPGKDVNDLMNAAIRQAYVNRSNRIIAPFDYRATYDYSDLNQLILHIHYIHIAPDGNYSVPCWLSKVHPQETASAQAAVAGSGLKVEICDGHFDWEEIRMLENMSAEIGGIQVNSSVQAEANAARAVVAGASRPLSAYAAKETETWQNTLFSKLNAWATADILHQNKFTAFRILYFQSLVRLEDYFLDKGLGQEDAKYLAIAAVRTIAGPSLGRFQ